MISSEEILTSIVNKTNMDPMNPKKFYFIFKEIIELNKSIILEIKFGVSENQSYIFRRFVTDGISKDQCKKELYDMAINKIIEIIYNVIDGNYDKI